MKTIAVASGKGGVGKTTLVANLGAALASAGQRVVLFDADLGLANLDVALGVRSDVNIQHVLGGLVRMPDCAVEGPGGLRAITGSSGIGAMLRLSRKRLVELLEKTSELESTTDLLIYDCASGADPRVMTFLTAADQVILVTTCDPAGIVDCYSTAKVLFRYRRDARIDIVVNKAPSRAMAQKAFETVESAVKEFLHKQVSYLGCIAQDQAAAEFGRKRQLFVLAKPSLQASKDVLHLSELLAGQAKQLDKAA